jgi:hypothetical protein
MVPATLDDIARRGLLGEIETLHLDRGYDNSNVRRQVADAEIADLVCAKQRRPGSIPAPKSDKVTVPLGLSWPVERTNSWFSNFGQLRRNTDRRVVHRLAQLAIAIAFILVAKLIDWRDRWVGEQCLSAQALTQ